jgi:Cu2+-containing amine oxidase
VASGERPLAVERKTLWHSVGALHSPRDEDFGPVVVDAARGAALTEWVGFTLRPRNLFDGTPSFDR